MQYFILVTKMIQEGHLINTDALTDLIARNRLNQDNKTKDCSYNRMMIIFKRNWQIGVWQKEIKRILKKKMTILI